MSSLRPRNCHCPAAAEFFDSLSDYANRKYWPNPALVSPGCAANHGRGFSFRGATVASVDADMALRITNLIVGSTGQNLQTHVARTSG